MSEYVTALAQTERAVLADPGNASTQERACKTKAAVFGNLAACHLKSGALDEAVKAATQSLAEVSSNAKILFRRALAYRKLGKLDLAHLDLRRALEIDPSNMAIQQEMNDLQKALNPKKPQAKGKSLYLNMFKGIEGSADDRTGKNTEADMGQGPFYAAGPCDLKKDSVSQHPVLSLLQQEVVELSEASPLGFVSMDEPQPVVFVNADTADRTMIRSPGEGWHGPWLIELRIQGPARSDESELPHPGAYDHIFRVQLCVPSEYPQVPPRIRFRSVIQHAYIKDADDQARQNERRVGPVFFKQLAQRARKPDSSVVYSLWEVCELLCEMLEYHRHVPSGVDVEQWHTCRQTHCRRLQTISAYPRFMKHPEVFDAEAGWRREWFDPDLARVLFTVPAGPDRDHQLRELFTEVTEGAYSFQLFTPSFCEIFLNELDNFMQTCYNADIFTPEVSVDFPGKFLNAIGWEPMADLLLRDVLQPIAALLFPRDGAQLDSIHPFLNRYKPDLNQGLDMHRDNSDISFTGCLGRTFEGGALNFCGVMGNPDHRKMKLRYYHKTGRCITHLGHHRHGVDKTTAGEKVSLVMWCQNIALRSDREHEDRIINLRRFQPEDGPPDRDCLSWTHDRDFGVFKPYPKGSEPFRKFQWYPTPEAEYPGFRPDRASKPDALDSQIGKIYQQQLR